MYKLVMGAIAAVVLGVSLAGVVSVQPEEPEEPPGHYLDFTQGERFRTTSAAPRVIGGRFNCIAEDDFMECIRAAGKDVCAKDETFEIERLPGVDRMGRTEFTYRCRLRVTPPDLAGRAVFDRKL